MEVKQMNDSFFCENEGHYFFYDASTGFMSETSRVFNDVISAYRKYNNIEDAKKELSLTYNFSQIDGILDEVVQLKERGIIFNNRKIPVIRCADIQEEEWDKGNVLENLILNISHECNMRCKYCFADHGHFQSKAALMSKKIAKDSIDYWFGHLDKSRKRTSITFFGGEPLLNKEVFLYSLEYIESLLEGTGVIPTYAITTNGTLINDELIQIFLKYRMQPDISVDGGMYVQNKNRPLRTGNGSYNMVVESAKKLRNYYDRLVAKITLIHEDVDKLKQEERELSVLQMRDVRHGMRNHLLSILAYAERGEREKLIQFVTDIIEDGRLRPSEEINTGNIVTDSLVGYWKKKAEDAGIEFLTDLSIPMEMPFRGADISLIMGNLLENAVEGAGRAEGRKYIRLKMKYDKNNLLITIENSYRGKLAKGKGEELRTTKTDTSNHGIGLPSVRRAADKYQGVLSVDTTEPGRFLARVVLYGS